MVVLGFMVLAAVVMTALESLFKKRGKEGGKVTTEEPPAAQAPLKKGAGRPAAERGAFCTRCGTEAEPAAEHCTKCGETLEVLTATPKNIKPELLCSRCGTETTPPSKYCEGCGYKLGVRKGVD